MTKRDVLHANLTGHGLPSGFTLVELMVTVAVVAILLAMGAPQLGAFLNKQRVAADADALGTAIRQARSEALKRSGPVSVCALPATFNPTAPACAANGTTNWSNGWLVFIDYGTAGVLDTGDTVLRVVQHNPSASTVLYNSGASITVMPNGLLQGFNNGTFYLSPGNASSPASDPQCQCVKVSQLSRLTTGKCSLSNGTPQCT
jgi:type IV fimbrial biogenesis protein FimT